MEPGRHADKGHQEHVNNKPDIYARTQFHQYFSNYYCQGVCSQLEHSIVTLMTSQGPLASSNDVQSNLVSELLNKWHIPHFSTQSVSILQMER